MRRITLIAAIVALAAGFLLLDSASLTPNGGLEAKPRYSVRVTPAPFDVHLTQTGVLRSRRSISLASELPSNKAKIIRMIPEGAYVKAGDVLVEFDSTPFEEDITRLRAELLMARAQARQAEEELGLLIQQHKAEQDKQRYQAQLAAMELASLKEADGPMRLDKAEQELAAAESDLRDASREREAVEEMLLAGFSSKQDLLQARRTEAEAKTAHAAAAKALRMLRDVLLPNSIAKARIEIKKIKSHIRELDKAHEHKLARQQAMLLKASQNVVSLQEALDRAQNLLAKTTLQAPVEGFVIHREVPVQGEKRKVQVGDSVWNRQVFLVLPDMSELVVDLAVPERDIGRLRAGQTVSIQPQAYPDLMLTGTVESIGTLTEAASSRLSVGGSPVFHVQVAMQDKHPQLRPGMTAEVEVLLDHHEQALCLPVEAVHQSAGGPFCYLKRDGHVRKQGLALGDSNGDMVMVTHGLSAGDDVVLATAGQ